ncbi:hypothetical protein DFH28DRAFT_923210 [Melampsora americana]|nr:hypothetical protein DFH28DRAFT_923210 [Melampsora americana]
MDSFSGTPHTNGDTPSGWSQAIWFQACREAGAMASHADDVFELISQAVMGLVKFYGVGLTIVTVLLDLKNPQHISLGLAPLFKSAISMSLCVDIVDITADDATYTKELKGTRKRKYESVENKSIGLLKKRKRNDLLSVLCITCVTFIK